MFTLECNYHLAKSRVAVFLLPFEGVLNFILALFIRLWPDYAGSRFIFVLKIVFPQKTIYFADIYT